WGTKTTSTHSS
ncbi:hypothetical protein V3C99_018650, partial [Haemonchus contortus]